MQLSDHSICIYAKPGQTYSYRCVDQLNKVCFWTSFLHKYIFDCETALNI